jgi:hypothetical protein
VSQRPEPIKPSAGIGQSSGAQVELGLSPHAVRVWSFQRAPGGTRPEAGQHRNRNRRALADVLPGCGHGLRS